MIYSMCVPLRLKGSVIIHSLNVGSVTVISGYKRETYRDRETD